MAYRRRRGGRCTRWKRVRVRGQGYAKRCAKYSGSRRRARGGYRRKPKGMARRGSTCTRMKSVYSPRLRRRVRRCANFR